MDASLLVAIPVFGAGLWFQFAGAGGYGHGGLVGAGLAAAAVVLFFASVLVHEFAHAYEARHRHVGVAGVTLLFFGGFTAIERTGRSPRDDLMVAALGPFVSFVASALFGIIAMTSLVLIRDGRFELQPLADLAGFLAWTNFGLGAFNLLPGLPLDGGRVVRAVVWRVSGSRTRATRGAAHAGQGVAVALVGAMVLAAIRELWIAAGATAVIAVFMFVGARRELQTAAAQARLLERAVRGFVTKRPTVPASVTVEETAPLLDEHDAVVVVDERGEVVGVLDRDSVQGAPASALRGTFGAREVMTPIGDVAQVDGDESLRSVDALLRNVPAVIVVQNSEISHVLTRQDVGQILAVRDVGTASQSDREDRTTQDDTP